jgi:ubiquitin-like domain-containing CTD phosphatase 1
MKLLGVTTNQNYKILGYLDYLAMISVHMDKYGLLDVRTNKKNNSNTC